MTFNCVRELGLSIILAVGFSAASVEARSEDRSKLESLAVGDSYRVESMSWDHFASLIDLAAHPFDSRLKEREGAEVPSNRGRLAMGDSLFKFGKFIGRFQIELIQSKKADSSRGTQEFFLRWKLLRPERNFSGMSFKTQHIEIVSSVLCGVESCEIQSRVQASGFRRFDLMGVHIQERFDRMASRLLAGYDERIKSILLRMGI